MTTVTINAALLHRAGIALGRDYLTGKGSHVVPREVIVSEGKDVLVTDGSYLYLAWAGELFPRDWYVVPRELVPTTCKGGTVDIQLDHAEHVTLTVGKFLDTIKHVFAVKDDTRVPPCVFSFNYAMLAVKQMGRRAAGALFNTVQIPGGDFYHAENNLSFGWRKMETFSDTEYRVHVAIAGVII